MSAATQKRARAAVVAAAMSLEAGEQGQAMVCGQHLAFDAVALLTDRRIIVANGRPLAPEVNSIALSENPEVKGWAEGGRATLRFSSASDSLVIGDIKEVDAAQALAAAIRAQG